MGLPAPLNGTEQYLAAVYDRLGEILDRLPELAAPDGQLDDGEPKELREPARQPVPAHPEPKPVEITERKRPPGGENAGPSGAAAQEARKPAARKATARMAAKSTSTATGTKTGTKSTRKGT
jgi:hypothetical protein